MKMHGKKDFFGTYFDKYDRINYKKLTKLIIKGGKYEN
jgi:hypothetical protein